MRKILFIFLVLSSNLYSQGIKKITMNFDNIHPTIFAIIDDGKGNLLLGTSNGLYHYTGSSNKLILSGDRLDELRINDVQHYKDKKFLIGTDRAIYKYDLESDQLSIIKENIHVKFISKTQSDTNYFVTIDSHVYRLENEKTIQVFPKIDLLQNERVKSISLKKKDHYKLYIENRSDTSKSRIYDSQLKTEVKWLEKDRTYSRIHNSQDEIEKIIDNYDNYKRAGFFGIRFYNWGLGGNIEIRSIFYDQNNYYWIGTTNGLYRYTKPTDGIEKFGRGKIRGIIKAKNGLIYYAKEGEIVIHDSIKPTRIAISYVSSRQVNPFSLYEEKNGRILVGTDGDGMYILENGKLKIPKEEFNFLAGRHIIDIEKFSPNKFWFGLDNGIHFYDEITKEHLHYNTNNRIFDFKPYKKGVLAGGRTGLYYAFKDENGLNVTKLNTEAYKIRAMEEYDGVFFLATEEEGFIRFDPETNEFTSLGLEEGMGNETIYSLVRDGSYLYLGTFDGLILYCDKLKSYTKIYQEHGLSNSEFNSNSTFKDSDGNIYMGTQRGITEIRPKNGLKMDSNYNIGLESVSYVNAQEQTITVPVEKFNQGYVFPPESHMIKFDLRINDLYDPNENKLIYKLNDFGRQVVLKNSQIMLPYLQADDYKLEVKSLNAQKIWSANTLNLNFEVQQVFYKSWWFITLLGSAFLTMFILILYYQDRLQVKLFEAKNRFAADLHDEMGGDLTAIKYKLELLKPKVKNQELEELNLITSITEDTQINISDLIWSIKGKDHNFNRLFERIERLLEIRLSKGKYKYHFEYEGLNLSQKLNTDIKQNVYLIFKEALSNFMKHSEKIQFNVIFKPYKSGFQMKIYQDGKAIKARNAGSYGSFGIESMQKRASKIGAKIEIEESDNWTITLKKSKL